jgi:hypothetical protein
MKMGTGFASMASIAPPYISLGSCYFLRQILPGCELQVNRELWQLASENIPWYT